MAFNAIELSGNVVYRAIAYMAELNNVLQFVYFEWKWNL